MGAFTHVLKGLSVAVLVTAAPASLRAQAQPAFYSWAERPVMGWNSWDAYATTITEDQVYQIAGIMEAKLAPSGYRLLTIDIQWYEPTANGFDYHPHARLTMDQWGRLIPAPNKFPHGFAAIAQRLHQEGLKLGIHVMRGIPRQAVAARTPILGTSLTAADIADPSSTCSWNSDMVGVNMSKPGAQAYYDSVVAQYADWGVDFIKVDDLSRPYHGAEIAAIRRAIDKSGRPIVFSTSPGATPVSQGKDIMTLANQWRISDDFWDSWTLLDEQFDRLRDWTPYRGPGHFPDADMLPLGVLALGKRSTQFTAAEQRTLFTLWCIARSPLILGADPRHLDPATLALVTNPELIAIDQESANNREVWRKGTITAWAASADKPGLIYVALFNRGEAPATAQLDARALGLAGRFVARDLWAGRTVGVFTGSAQVRLAAHDACCWALESP